MSEELKKSDTKELEKKVDKMIKLLELIAKKLSMPLQTVPYQRQIITKRQKE